MVARPLVGLRRLRVPPIVRVLGYWRAERRTIRLSLGVLLLATGGNVVAGITLGSVTGTLERVPGLLILLPAAVATRGNIFGAMAARLGTAIHLGSFEVSRTRAGPLMQNAIASTVLTFGVSVALGVAARLLALLFGLPASPVDDLIVLSALGGCMAGIIVGALTVGLAVAADRWSWDLDSIGSPIVTASGDIVTIPALLVASTLVGRPYVTPALAIALSLAAVAAVWSGWRIDLPVARRAVREGLPVLIGAGVVALGAGVLIHSMADRLLAFPVLLALVPPLLADAGDLGATFSARLASKLHLGTIEPRAWPDTVALLDTTIVYLSAAWVFGLLGVTMHLAGSALGLGSPGLGSVVGVSMVAGLVATTASVLIGYYAAVTTFRVGLDPDSHSLPVITSSMDVVGMMAFTAALAMFGLS